jgi:hypothetical protein
VRGRFGDRHSRQHIEESEQHFGGQLTHHVFCDFIQHAAIVFYISYFEILLYVPGNSFAFSVVMRSYLNYLTLAYFNVCSAESHVCTRCALRYYVLGQSGKSTDDLENSSNKKYVKQRAEDIRGKVKESRVFPTEEQLHKTLYADALESRQETLKILTRQGKKPEVCIYIQPLSSELQ